ncbi:hypothetical protein [Metapseudomonas boanensis]|uniref:O-antigen ligase n=1 Tax=Metapseudomonas boanensis TaxID=2822138 RepID=A0ABS5XDM6_9GAMM|nr:hypothetical protein [Pseudomonas boanensis]MBT8765792.1 hypothetical protein [Pseudomonas boanensis]
MNSMPAIDSSLISYPVSARNVFYAGTLLSLLTLSLPFTRLVSGVNLILFAVLFAVFAFLNRRAQKLPGALAFFCSISLCYAVLSVFNVFPSVWTRYFQISAIPQQALFAYAIPTTFLVMTFYFKERIKAADGRRGLANLFLLWVVMNYLDMLTSDAFSFKGLVSISGLGNVPALVIAATSLYLSTIKTPGKRVGLLLVFLAMSFMSPFSQNKIYALIFAGMWLFPRYAFWMLVALISSSVLLYASTVGSPLSVAFIDANLAVRLVLLRDALEGIVGSNFIGVGFGTESIRNYYLVFDSPVFANEEEAGFIHLSVHNSFAAIPFRVGLVGFIALLVFLWQTLMKVKADGPLNEKALKCSLFAAFFIVSFQNPAIESYAYLYGVCMYLSLIWAFDRPVIEIDKRLPVRRSGKDQLGAVQLWIHSRLR